jgi:hypothetical protein
MTVDREASALAWDEQPASAEEIAAAAEPASEEERTATLELVRWFNRRYPTYAERAEYIRRKWREAELLRRAGVAPG